MDKKEITMPISTANLLSFLLIIPVSGIYFFAYYLISYNESSIPSFKNTINNIALEFGSLGLSIIIFGIFILGIIIHELIHGVSWGISANNGFKSIKFGVAWKMLTPYCHCKEPLQVKQYIIGAIMPFIILGLTPSIYAAINNNFGIFLLGIFFTMAAGGDLIMVYLLRNENMNSKVQDHPSEMGCYIFK